MYPINNQFVAICAGIIFFIVIVTSPLRVKLVLKKAGEIKIRFTKKKFNIGLLREWITLLRKFLKRI